MLCAKIMLGLFGTTWWTGSKLQLVSVSTIFLLSINFIKLYNLIKEKQIRRLSSVLLWSIIMPPSVPCVPTDVMVSSSCGQSFAQVTWQPSLGAVSYQVSAEDRDGQHSLCFSNETSCRLESLTCGQLYNIGVAALGNNCSSNLSYAETVQTGNVDLEREQR